MTCEECRKIMLTPQSFTTSTRGFRAVVWKHINGCKKCQRWGKRQLAKRDPIDNAIKGAKAVAILEEDLADPEFRDAIGL